MELCPHCGRDIPPGAPFCPHCGQALLGVTVRRVCPSCHATIPPGAQFCPDCGASVLVGAPAPTGSMHAGVMFGAIGTQAPPTTPRGTAASAQTDTDPGQHERQDWPDRPGWQGMAPARYPTFTTFPTTPGAHDQPFAGVWPLSVSPDTPTYAGRRRGRAGDVVGTLRTLAARHPWPTLGGALLGLLLLAYAVPVLPLRRDWAAGAAAMGVVAAVLAVLIFAGLGIWALRPGRPRREIAGGLLATLLLAALAVGGLAGSATIHTAQASFAARGEHWAEAIAEDRALGTPAATQQMLAVYAEWMAKDPGSVPYTKTIAFLGTLRASATCGSACRRAALDDEVHARYLYGQQQVTARNEQAAVAQFTTIEKLAPGSTYARLAHLSAAAAYDALAQQQAVAHACSAEITFYQTLATSYADTAQGKAAAKVLAAGVTVSGTISGLPNPTATTLYLSKTVHPWHSFSDDYHTRPSANGSFTFSGVQPGKYNLSGTGVFGLTYWHDASPPYNPYTITVGQVCPVTAGTYPY